MNESHSRVRGELVNNIYYRNTAPMQLQYLENNYLFNNDLKKKPKEYKPKVTLITEDRRVKLLCGDYEHLSMNFLEWMKDEALEFFLS